MKKWMIMSLVSVLILGNVSTVFAADTAGAAAEQVASPPAVTETMHFSGTAARLSVDEAYKKMMADSASAKMAELNRQSADVVAKGHGESVQQINNAKDNYGIYDSASAEMVRLSRAFATAQAPKNYDAEMNNLKTSTFKNYYELKEMENQVKIAADNLSLKEKLLSNTQLKFKVGTVSKQEVLQAELAVNEARDTHLTTVNGLTSMRMGFNQFMGYGLMQNVSLTDEIKEVPLSSISLSEAIQLALANRNEISGAKFNVEFYKANLAQYNAYPHSSSKYISAEMNVLIAETNLENAPIAVEREVRSKYLEMTQQHATIQTSKQAVEDAKETERLAQLQFDAGLGTLSDVQGAQLAYYKAQLAYSESLLKYNLAVNAYEVSTTVGVEASVIK